MESASLAPNRAEVLVSPTWSCNLRCKYCFVQENEIARDGDFMSPDLAVRVIDALDEGLPDVDSITVHLYGGEPFLNLPAARAMVERAALKKPGRIQFSVTTNGTVLNDEVIDILNKGNFSIVLSIDGPPEVHNECRLKVDGSPSQADVIKFLETVRAQTKCHVTGSSVVRSGWGLRQATEFLRTLPIHTIKAQAVRVPEGTPYALSPEERQQYMDDLEYIGQETIKELEAEKFPLDRRYANRVLSLLKGAERNSFCGAGNTTYGITPDGKVLPCILLDEEEYYLGHINDEPVTWREAGKNWKARPLRPECHECGDLSLCGGGCPAMYSVCAEDECELVAKNCEVARKIHKHFVDKGKPEDLLGLAGIF